MPGIGSNRCASATAGGLVEAVMLLAVITSSPLAEAIWYEISDAAARSKSTVTDCFWPVRCSQRWAAASPQLPSAAWTAPAT